MVSRRRLAARAVELTSLPTTSPTDIVLHPAGRRPIRLDQPTLGFQETVAAELARSLEIDDAAPVLSWLLTEPARCYELESGDDSRAVCLLGAVQIGDESHLVDIEIVVDFDPRRRALAARASAATAPLSRADSRDILVQIAGQLTPEGLTAKDPDGRPPAMLVVGDMTSDQRAHLTRRVWAHGVRVEAVLEQPYRAEAETIRHVSSFHGNVALFLVDGCRDSLGRFLSAVRDTAPVIITLQDPDLWPLEVDEVLDALAIDDPQASQLPPPPETEPKLSGWLRATAEIRALIVAEDPCFVVTDRCLRRMPKCRYPFPEVMVSQMQNLRRFAERWSVAVRHGGLGGDIVTVAREEFDLSISLHDTPMRRAKLDSFSFQNGTYSREPHVKVDEHTTPDRVGRIYFALDDEAVPPRIIVDHVGLKLSPYVKR
jgi:hypothetical protein